MKKSIINLLLISMILIPCEASAEQQDSLRAGATAAITEMLIHPEATELEQNIVEEAPEYIEIEATAYYNRYNRACKDGTWPYVGTLAGKHEWLGRTCRLYDSDMNYMGEYTFHDVGYGKSTGWGESYLLEGCSVGTIEAGLCIDIYMSSESECRNYGRQKVFIEWTD